MRWIDKLERKYGRYGIPNLMNVILIGQVILWVLIMFVNKDLYSVLSLTRTGLLHGQIWRLISFVFLPTLTTSILSLALQLYFYWWIGNSLERAWGDFRFMVYWIVGMVGAVISCLIAGGGNTAGLFLSMFFAYAWMWPDQQVLLFFIIPIKIKWLGWVSMGLWVIQFVTGSFATKLCLLFGIAGFLAFFGKELWDWCRTTLRDYKRRRDWNNKQR